MTVFCVTPYDPLSGCPSERDILVDIPYILLHDLRGTTMSTYSGYFEALILYSTMMRDDE